MSEWPYEYGSDLHWIWGWGKNLESYLEDHEISPYARFLFRPSDLARDAMMRLGIEYPLVIKQVEDYLDHAEKLFLPIVEERATAADVDNFGQALEDLFCRIIKAAETIGNAQRKADEASKKDDPSANSANTARLFPGGVPDKPDIVDLVCRLDAGKGFQQVHEPNRTGIYG